MTDDGHDIQSLSLCAWKEARGERGICIAQGLQQIDGCRAVMHVCKNRIGTPGFPHTLHDVIYQKNAFSGMSRPTDPQFNSEPEPGDEIFSQCLKLAEAVLNGTDEDNTKGSRYYWDPKTSDPHGWFARNIVSNPKDHPFLCKIGHHDFYA